MDGRMDVCMDAQDDVVECKIRDRSRVVGRWYRRGAKTRQDRGAVGGIDTAALCVLGVCSYGESGAGCASRRARRKETPRREEAEEKPERMCG